MTRTKPISPLAIQGGAPTRNTEQKPWTHWPIHDEAEENAVLEVVRSGQWWSAGGTQVVALEQEFASFHDAQFGVACTNGTASLEIALRVLGIGCGDEVLIPSYTFVATATAVLTSSATPVLVEIQGDTLNMDPAAIEEAITARTRAIMPVHMAGRPADLDAIRAIAAKHDLFVIEDAAQAHAAAWRGTRVGAMGDIGCFSFQASKNLNAGEGGFVLSNQQELADAAWSVVNAGHVRGGRRPAVPVLGSNYRMTEFQAALARVQMSRLAAQTATRTANATYLRSQLAPIEGIELPLDDPRITCHAYHLFTFRYHPEAFGGHSYREFIAALNAEGIPCSAGYQPLYKNPLFARRAIVSGGVCRSARDINYPCMSLPVCEQVCADTVWMSQRLLLGAPSDMDDIATAILRIQSAWVR